MELLLSLGVVWGMKLIGFLLGICLPLLDLIPSVILPKKENIEAAASFRHETKQLLKQFRLIRVFQLWKQAVEKESRLMVHRKVLFLGVFIVFAVFVITSTGSVLGLAVIAGFSSMVAAQLLPDLQRPDRLRSRFFSDLSAEATDRTVQSLGVIWVILAVVSIWITVLG